MVDYVGTDGEDFWVITSQDGTSTVDGGEGHDELFVDWFDKTSNVAAVIAGSAGSLIDPASATSVEWQSVEFPTIRSGSGDDYFEVSVSPFDPFSGITLLGSAGNDTLSIDLSGSSDSFEGTDRLVGGVPSRYVDWQGIENLIIRGGVSFLWLTDHTVKTVDIDRGGTVWVDRAQDDRDLTVSLNADGPLAEASQFRFQNLEALEVTTGSGDDTFYYKGGQILRAIGGAGEDSLTLDWSETSGSTEWWIDPGLLQSSSGYYAEWDVENVSIKFGSGHDLVVVTGSESLNIDLGGGDDTFHGGAGNDYIVAGAGNDYVGGGAGDDTFAFNFSLASSLGATYYFRENDEGTGGNTPSHNANINAWQNYMDQLGAWRAALTEQFGPDLDQSFTGEALYTVKKVSGSLGWYDNSFTTAGTDWTITSHDGTDTVGWDEGDRFELRGLAQLSSLEEFDSLFDVAINESDDTVLSWAGGSITVDGLTLASISEFWDAGQSNGWFA